MSKKDKIKENTTPIAVIVWIAMFVLAASYTNKNYAVLIIFLMGLLIIFLLDKVHKQNIENRKREYMLWFVCDKSNKFGVPDWKDGDSLYNIFLSKINILNDLYPISKSELEFVKLIVEEFRTFCRKQYCNGKCLIPKTNNRTDKAFFFAELFYYLKEYSYERKFCEQTMRNNIPGKEDAFALTDFAVVYFKMMLICRLVCDKNETFNNVSYYPIDECDYKRIIEEKILPSFAKL